MKSKEILLVGVFAVSLLVLMIGVLIGSRATPPLAVGAMPPGAISPSEMPAAGAKAAVLAHQGGGGARLDYYPPAP